MKRLLCILLFGAVLAGGGAGRASAAGWQWSVLVRNSREYPGEARAFLWIPPKCERVRGVVLAQHNMEEISILENPGFRAALAELNFAEVWVSPRFDHLFRFNEGAGGTFNGIMSDLAEASGYAELNLAPIVGMGHSAAASWPYYFAAWNPERALAALSVSGQWPYYRDPQWAPDIWGDRSIDFIPCLETMGEYEAANTWSGEGLKERREHPLLPLGMLACPAEGHFASSDSKAQFLALFIRKAVQYRMPENWPIDAAPKLKRIDPAKTGWFADKWRQDQKPSAPAAPVGEYRGNAGEAFWCFDQELAQATEKYQADYRGLKPQLVGYLQGGKMVAQKNDHLQVELKFEPEADGVTFKLAGGFYNSVPEGSPRLPQWTGLPVGSPIGHAKAGGPVRIERICGPVEQSAPDTFALRLQRDTTGLETRYELVFAAKHPGDAEYKPAVQQAHMFVPARNKDGAEQRITFPKIPRQKAGSRAVKLGAASDANVPVYYYVREGPAEIDGDTLRFTAIPPRAKFPVKVTVVAWQFGRSVEPKLKTAEPVAQTILIEK